MMDLLLRHTLKKVCKMKQQLTDLTEFLNAGGVVHQLPLGYSGYENKADKKYTNTVIYTGKSKQEVKQDKSRTARSEALARGLHTYTGMKCTKCHTVERYVITRKCVKCMAKRSEDAKKEQLKRLSKQKAYFDSLDLNYGDISKISRESKVARNIIHLAMTTQPMSDDAFNRVKAAVNVVCQ